MDILKAKSKLHVMTNKILFCERFVLACNLRNVRSNTTYHFPLVQVRVICSASAPLSSLFLHQHHAGELEQSRILMDDLGLSQVVGINIILFYYKTA